MAINEIALQTMDVPRRLAVGRVDFVAGHVFTIANSH